MYIVLQNLYHRIQRSFFLLGDSGYPLRPWLLRPFRGNPDPGTLEAEYNSRHTLTNSFFNRTIQWGAKNEMEMFVKRPYLTFASH
jgi:hypothetical protein